MFYEMRGKDFVVVLTIWIFGCSDASKSLVQSAPNETPPPTVAIQASPTVESQHFPPYPPNETERKWSDSIDGDSLDWDGSDLFVQEEGEGRLGIFSRIAWNYCRTVQRGPDRNCYCGHSIRLASVVGTIVSFEHESDFSCSGSHLRWRYASLDLKKSGDFIYPRLVEFETKEPFMIRSSRMVSLTELFSEADILDAFLANERINREITKAIAEKKIERPPNTLREFDQYFARFDPNIFDGFLRLEKDYLTRFVFHHLEGKTVSVWISLTPTSHVSQAVHEHLEILLPISDKLQQTLLLADARKQGFLMKDANEAVGTSYAQFELGGKH